MKKPHILRLVGKTLAEASLCVKACEDDQISIPEMWARIEESCRVLAELVEYTEGDALDLAHMDN